MHTIKILGFKYGLLNTTLGKLFHQLIIVFRAFLSLALSIMALLQEISIYISVAVNLVLCYFCGISRYYMVFQQLIKFYSCHGSF